MVHLWELCSANLSETYFTNRQDRYVLVEDCKELADYYTEIISAVASCSFQLNSSGSLTLPQQCRVNPVEGKGSRSDITRAVARMGGGETLS